MDDDFMDELEERNHDGSDSDEEIVAHKRKRMHTAE